MSVSKIDNKQIKSIWGLSKEVDIDKENLYSIIFRISNQDSMKALTMIQANEVILELIKLKDKGSVKAQKRTDEGGRSSTVAMRQKIYKLCEELGWNNTNERINGFCKKRYNVERIEWLTDKQCFYCIEALKKMVQRIDKDGREKTEAKKI